MSWPSKRIVPDVGSSSRRISRAVVDLPQPDSPTIPSVSPRRTVSVTSSTACTSALPRANTPCLTGKRFVRCSSSTRFASPSRSCRRLRGHGSQADSASARLRLELALPGQVAGVEVRVRRRRDERRRSVGHGSKR